MLGCLAVPTHLESDSIASLIIFRPLHEEDCRNISTGVNCSSACDGELAVHQQSKETMVMAAFNISLS